MGRGGKKKNKKDAQGEADDSKPSTSQEKQLQETTQLLTTLSVSESNQPSTSKIPDKDIQHETKSEQTKPKEIKPEPTKPENTKPVDDYEEDSLGLGLTSGKARRKRKPKGAAAQTKPPVQVQSPTGPQSAGPPQPRGPEPPTGPQQYPSGPQIPPSFEHPASVQQPFHPYPAIPQQPSGPYPAAPPIGQGRGQGQPRPQYPVAPQHPPGAYPASVQQPFHPYSAIPQQPSGPYPAAPPIGQGRGQGQPRPQYPVAPQHPPGAYPASVQQPFHPYPAISQQPSGPYPAAPPIERGRGQGQPRPQYPVAPQHPPGAYPAVPQQPGGSYPAAPQQPGGRGRGQGPTWGAPQQPPPGMAAVPSQAPAPTFQQRKQQEPVQFLHESSPALSSKSSDSSSSEYKRPSPTVSRFKIPDKKLLPEVPAMKIKVVANYLRLKFQDLKIHRYDVAIKPDKPKKMLSKVFEETKKKYFKDHVIAFDQKKNLFTLKPLTGSITQALDVTTEVIDSNGAPMQFELVFKHTGIVDLATLSNYMKSGGSTLELPMEAIQCVDVILQQATLGLYVKAGRQYFKRPHNPINLTHGMEMWTGLFQSAIFNSGSFINIDVAHKGFPKHQTLLDAVVNDFQMDPNKELEGQRGFEEFKHFLKGLRVTALIGGDSKTGRKREFICNSVVAPPYKLSFSMTDAAGKTSKCTVDKYFEVEKKYRLRYPRLNCLWVGPKEKNIYYPMELLEVVYGQAINKQLSDKQLPVMVREAATAPNIRLQKIHDVIQCMQYSTNPQFKKFGLDIADRLTVVDAKILKVPKLNVGNMRSVEPRRGAWQAPGLLQAQALQKWAIILLDGNPKYCQIAPVANLLMGVGRSMGMKIEQPLVMRENVTMRDLRNTLFDMVQKGVNFVVIVFTGRDRDAYHKVKRTAELEVGVLTQCIKEFTASKKMNEQTMRNILLKINSKLMGVNQALDATCMPKCLQGGGVMLVGADVTHPSPDQSSVPSIAAVTASIDSKYFIYNIELSIQTPKREMILQFEDMMVDHFKVYQKHNGNELPRRIYVLRDGVSDGQFGEVMNSELVALQQAYRRMAGPQAKKPEILFVLVQKRHHTRLFTTDRVAQNVEPGTVVDTDIVHQRELNFFLVSHQAIKGTARPTRYHCVCNDGNLSVGEVEQLAFYLCHLYSRCSRSVSYPTPTYYAHLACFRARSLTFGDHYDNNDLERNPKRIRVMDKMLQFSRMFFV